VPTLQKLRAREVFDSRGHPTVEVEAIAVGGGRGLAMAPSGGSIGRHEARELRDGDHRRHGGRGVRKAVALIASEVAPALAGIDLDDQEAIDSALIALDGTPDKSRLGANAILATSIASARAAASARHEELHFHLNRLWRRKLPPEVAGRPSLPLPMAHMISGTAYVGRTLDFQDILMVPVGARDFSEAVAMTFDVYRALGEVLHKHGHPAHLTCPHGGYGPKLWGNAQAVDHLLEAVLFAGLGIGRDVVVALDVGATHFHDPATSTYTLAVGRESHDSAGMIAMLEHWTRQYPIASIEDGLGQDDWDGWADLTGRLGATVQVVGDDLFATRADRIASGLARKAANAVTIKPGQVGTLTETFDALAMARQLGVRTIVSCRTGETEDTILADLAVATGSGQVKLGGVARSERLAKYNRLLRIEDELGPAVAYAGRSAITAAVNGTNGTGHQANDVGQ